MQKESNEISLIKDKLKVKKNENSKLVSITPEIAHFLLTFNTNNRPISTHRVNVYTKMMKKGDWSLTNDMITFNSSGILTNGQHRLYAIEKSKKDADFFIAFNVDNSMGMDNGKSRSLTDNLVLFDSCNDLLKSERIIHQALRAMLFIYKGSYDAMYLSPNSIVRILNVFESELIELLNAGILSRPWRSKTSQSVILASFILAYLNGVALDDLIHIRQVLNSGITTSERDYPIIALRDKLYTFIGSGRDIETLRATCTQYCIKNFVNNTDIKGCRAGNYYYTYDFSSILD